jgi:hypothetical protein
VDDNYFKEIITDVHTGYLKYSGKELSIFMEPVIVQKKILDIISSNDVSLIINKKLEN